MKRKIITIGRQCGSGGHIIGELAAKKLGIGYYDRNLLDIAKDYGEISSDILNSVDEKATNPLFYKLVDEGNENVKKELSPEETLFCLQSDVIRGIAKREDCIIVGRCADFILENDDTIDLLKIYCISPLEIRIQREMERNNINLSKAGKQIKKTDKRRGDYYRYFTKRDWQNPQNYDLILNTGNLGIERSVDLLVQYFQHLS